MKRITIVCAAALCVLSLAACRKDCVCKYYRDGKFYDVKTWDGKDVTEEDCESMNDRFDLDVPISETMSVSVTDIEVVCEQK